MMTLLLVAALAAPVDLQTATPPPAATGPSFDCHAASTPAMRLICASPALSQMDRQVAASYRAARAALADPTELDANHAQWAERVNRCQDAACLESEYRERIAAFRQSGF